MLVIDGAMGEGGGQILRTSLALSLCHQRPFLIKKIRHARRNPGLRPQHLAAIRAAAAISGAELSGDCIGSQEFSFAPGPLRPGSYRFDIGTAGSTSLVLQTLLPALLHADRASRLTIEGGTHNPQAPTFEFLDLVFLPLLRRMGAGCQ
jgi:RNA 3'-terminal phosphate cyclase (ATP)